MSLHGMRNYQKLLVIVAGPTASGKTDFAIELALRFQTCILSCDSRQFYREMRIGTAVPSDEQLAKVRHYFVANLSVTEYYNAARYETEAIKLLEYLFWQRDVVIACGGSGLYIDALCHGIDHLPDPDPELRKELQRLYQEHGLVYLRQRLKELDEVAYARTDLNNPNRMLRAIEVSLVTGKPYSSLLRHEQKFRPFGILKIALNLPRPELHDRISRRSDQMIRDGLVEEVIRLQPFREHTALNTVGYKEIFAFLDGKMSLDQAIANIKTATRRYARRQITWFGKDKAYHWLSPSDLRPAVELVEQALKVEAI